MEKWDLSQIFKQKQSSALIILNQPLIPKEYFKTLWKNTKVHLVADGGANRLFDFLAPEERLEYLPTIIQGDLDSIRKDTRDFYNRNGVDIVLDTDQDTTDFHKCLNNPIIKDYKDVYVLGALNGRLDHTMAALHTLVKYKRRIFLISDESFCWYLEKGKHEIVSDPEYEGDTCGLIPLLGRALVISSGLKWNLNHDMPLEFGLLVSTSNAFENKDGRFVFIDTDKPIIWTVASKFK
ncbi:cAMP-dependent protein kinase subunit [Boothiomyces sp. JEL0866]|nr:cAMP-dependent protein kinase subunit [Boothiomyces sp. JEL0866]